MRVTILGINYAPETTGIAPYTTGLAEGLRDRGHRVTVLTGVPHYPQWSVDPVHRRWDHSEDINGVRVRRLLHYVPTSPTHYRRMLMELSFGFRLISASWARPDLVVCVSPALFASLPAVVRNRMYRRRPRFVLWTQDLYSRGIVETASVSRFVARVMKGCEGYAARASDGVVAIHESFSAHLTGTLGVPDDNVSVIRNWTHLPPAAHGDRENVRSSLGWGQEDVIVLHAGNMGVKQGLENVVLAAGVAAENASAVRFVLLGDGSQRSRLKELGENVGNLQFIDPLPGAEFQAALSAADVLLLNERSGVQGMSVPSKLTSYFAAGKPVLAATGAGSASAEEIAASGGGVRVDPDDPTALLAAAEAIAADPASAARMGAAGQTYRRDKLSGVEAINQFEQYFSEMAGARRRHVATPLKVR